MRSPSSFNRESCECTVHVDHPQNVLPNRTYVLYNYTHGRSGKTLVLADAGGNSDVSIRSHDDAFTLARLGARIGVLAGRRSAGSENFGGAGACPLRARRKPALLCGRCEPSALSAPPRDRCAHDRHLCRPRELPRDGRHPVRLYFRLGRFRKGKGLQRCRSDGDRLGGPARASDPPDSGRGETRP